MSASTLVLITTSFPISGDGSESAGSFVSDLAEELAKHVFVRVVAPGRVTQREAWCNGVEVFRYAAPERPLSTLKPWQLVDLTQVLREGERATRAALAAGPAAHILALWALPSGEWARRASLATGVTYSVWTLGSDIWTLGRIPLVRNMLRRVLQQAKACYSDGLKLAEDTRNISGREVTFLPSTRRISSQGARPPAAVSPYRLLFLGRWHPNKGVDLLLDALNLLNESDWTRITCVEIQGGGPLHDLVHARVTALRASGRPVKVGGFLAKSEAEAAIARADWALIPSRIESIPVVFSDAMKMGRPVIAMPVGDLPQLVGQQGCGVQADAVTAVAFYQALRHALGIQIDNFSANVTTQAMRFDLSSSARRILRELMQHG